MTEIVDPAFAGMSARLLKGTKGYSQFGEHHFMNAVFGKKRRGYAVDVGASNGISISNTYHLEQRGWDVLCIEPNPLFSEELHKNRKNVLTVACGARRHTGNFSVYDIGGGNFEACSALKPEREVVKLTKSKLVRKFKVEVCRLDDCLEAAGFPYLDFASIDVEGGEADVLAGFNLDRWHPKMVIVEDWKGGQFRRFFCKHGYYIAKRLGPNEVFIRG